VALCGQIVLYECLPHADEVVEGRRCWASSPAKMASPDFAGCSRRTSDGSVHATAGAWTSRLVHCRNSRQCVALVGRPSTSHAGPPATREAGACLGHCGVNAVSTEHGGPPTRCHCAMSVGPAGPTLRHHRSWLTVARSYIRCDVGPSLLRAWLGRASRPQRRDRRRGTFAADTASGRPGGNAVYTRMGWP
jgi:hypothetical protein